MIDLATHLRLLPHMLTFGLRSATRQASDQRELLDVLTKVVKEPAKPMCFSHSPYIYAHDWGRADEVGDRCCARRSSM